MLIAISNNWNNIFWEPLVIERVFLLCSSWTACTLVITKIYRAILTPKHLYRRFDLPYYNKCCLHYSNFFKSLFLAVSYGNQILSSDLVKILKIGLRTDFLDDFWISWIFKISLESGVVVIVLHEMAKGLRFETSHRR